MKPKVTITMCSYNHEQYVAEALESFVNQSYGLENIEIIVVDDHSSDNTVNIIEGYAKKYNFEFYKNEKNMGVSHCHNFVTKKATGKYVCGCASDDFFELDRLEKQIQFFEENPDYGMVYSRAIVVNEKSEILYYDNHREKYYSGNIFGELLATNFIPSITTLIKKSVYTKVGEYQKGLKIEDYAYWLRIAAEEKIGFFDEYVSFYRLHSTNTYNSRSGTLVMVLDEKKIVDQWKHREEYKQAIRIWNAKWFSNLAAVNKRESLELLWKEKFNLTFNSKAIKGILKLLTPIWLYSAISSKSK